MGKETFVVIMTLVFFVCMFFTITTMFSFANLLFGIFDYTSEARALLVLFYTIAIIGVGIIMSRRMWDQNKIRFDGLNGLVKELEDEELKSLILENEKIKAAKRYRVITGGKLIESLRYVDLIQYYYSIKYQKD